MDRRKFVRGATLGALGIGAAGIACGGGTDASPDGAPAVHSRKKVRWRLASSFPRSLDTIYGGAEVLADRVSAMTDGSFDIRLHPAGEIVPALQVLDAVQQGTVQVGHSASYYYTGKNPAFAFDTCVPFGMIARQQNAWLHEGGGRALVDELFADFGVVTLTAGNTGVQMGGWFKREVPSLADLRGIKMRIPGLGGDVMSALGASVQVIAGGEIYPALERGAIDATDWVGPYDDERLGFHRAADYYYYPGWWEPGPSLTYFVSRKHWDELPSTYREVLRSAAQESADAMQARYDAKNPAALSRLLESGTQLRRFSNDLLAGARDAAREILEEQASSDAAYRKIFDHWDRARRESAEWFGTAELAYAQFAFG